MIEQHLRVGFSLWILSQTSDPSSPQYFMEDEIESTDTGKFVTIHAMAAEMRKVFVDNVGGKLFAQNRHKSSVTGYNTDIRIVPLVPRSAMRNSPQRYELTLADIVSR